MVVWHLTPVFCQYFLNKQMSLCVRNPFEVVKQRAQAYTHLTSLQALKYTLAEEVLNTII